MPYGAIVSRASFNTLLTAVVVLTLGYTANSPQLAAQPLLAQQRPTAAPKPTAPRPPTSVLVFKGVTVVDVTEGRLVPEQTVTVAQHRIEAVGPVGEVRIPAGARVVDARGKYLIPGLWDMHSHIALPYYGVGSEDSVYRANYPPFIAYGVTGIREMSQPFLGGSDLFRLWQREVLDGKRVGPRAMGPSADFGYQRDQLLVETPEQTRRLIDSLKAAGDLFVKYHNSMGDRQRFLTILHEARRAGLPVVGHVPRSVTNVEAADSGMRSIEHVQENHQCLAADPMAAWDSVAAEQRCRPVVDAYLRNGTWIVPTLVVYSYILDPNEEIVDENLLGRLTVRTFADAQRLVRMQHYLGVKNFLAGTDCVPEVYRVNWALSRVCHRGASLLEELGFLVGAGLTPLEALQSATLNPAKFLGGTDSLGTIAPGKLADLVLLDADPLADITNTTLIRAVVANGRYFDRAALDKLKAETAEPQ